MGKQNMELYQTYLAHELEAATALVREYQLAMMDFILSGSQADPVGPRDWSPRTGRCLCPKHKA